MRAMALGTVANYYLSSLLQMLTHEITKSNNWVQQLVLI